MKYLALASIIFLYSTTFRQGIWPLNQITHEVEFVGTLNWPAKAKSNSQRQALVRNWYLKKLTDVKGHELRDWAKEVHAQLTAYSLPAKAYHQYSTKERKYIIKYDLKIIPTQNKLMVYLSNFEIVCINDDSSSIIYLESLENISPEESKVLSAFKTIISKSINKNSLLNK